MRNLMHCCSFPLMRQNPSFQSSVFSHAGRLKHGELGMFLVSVSCIVAQHCVACAKCEPKASGQHQQNNCTLTLVTN